MQVQCHEDQSNDIVLYHIVACISAVGLLWRVLLTLFCFLANSERDGWGPFILIACSAHCPLFITSQSDGASLLDMFIPQGSRKNSFKFSSFFCYGLLILFLLSLFCYVHVPISRTQKVAYSFWRIVEFHSDATTKSVTHEFTVSNSTLFLSSQ